MAAVGQASVLWRRRRGRRREGKEEGRGGAGPVTTYVEGLIFCATIQNVLVAAYILANAVESLNHLQAQSFALVLLGDGDFFYMTNEAAAMDAARLLVNNRSLTWKVFSRHLQFPLHNQTPRADNFPGVFDGQ